MGLWLVLFLMEHLLVNSQAALLLGDNGKGFVDMVNSIHNLPYLQVIEVTLLGVPILIHLIWGVKYLFTSKFNSFKTDGSKPMLREYGRNRAYTWQRITSWILLVGLVGHVAKFRFLDYPTSVQEGSQSLYFVRVSLDPGLYSVADRLGVAIYDKNAALQETSAFQARLAESALLEAAEAFLHSPPSPAYDPSQAAIVHSAQSFKDKKAWIDALAHYSLAPGEVVAVSRDFGTASLLSVRDTFKSPVYAVLYTIFVLATCFHAFNGLWTFLITWGLILKASAQKSMVTFAVGLMLLIAFLGLASVWGTYWLNLRS